MAPPQAATVMGREPMPDPVTLVYKTVYASNSSSEGGPSGIPLHLDVYLPDSHSGGASASGDDGVGMPAVVYFHGGGLLVGDRKSWFPDWLQSESALASLRPPPLRAGLTLTRTLIRTWCRFSLGGLPTSFAFYGTRHLRRHSRPLRVHSELFELCSH